MQTDGRWMRDDGMRSLRGDALINALLESRQYTKALIDDLTDAQWRVPKLATINPVLWEIGHVGWFMERWCLRGGGNHPASSLIKDADRLYDSGGTNHADRWTLPLPSRTETLLYVDRVLEAVRDAIER